MKFSLNRFIREKEISVPFPKRYTEKYPDLEPAVLTLRLYTNEEAETARLTFNGLPDDARMKIANINEYVRQSVCALLTKEPQGFEDFPADSKCTLHERALEYFTNKPADEQEFLDEMLGFAYRELQDSIEDGVFRKLSSSVQGNPELQPGDSEAAA